MPELLYWHKKRGCYPAYDGSCQKGIAKNRHDPEPSLSDIDALPHLLRAVQNGDERAFARLYRLTAPKLFGLALRILKRHDLAEEILQEAFVKIWHHAESYSAEKGPILGWMATVVRYQAIDVLRKRQRAPIDTVPEDANWVDEAPNPLESAIQDREVQRLLVCLDALPPEQREMVIQAYLNGETHASLAQLHAAPLGTVKTWIRRALQRLKQCLENETGQP